jgi:hypothetical protein
MIEGIENFKQTYSNLLAWRNRLIGVKAPKPTKSQIASSRTKRGNESEQAGKKRCRICKTVKPKSKFYKARGMKDGLQNDCKPCRLAYNKKMRDQGKRRVND